MTPAWADYHAEPLYSLRRGAATHLVIREVLSHRDWPVLAEKDRKYVQRQLEAVINRLPETMTALDVSDMQATFAETPAAFIEDYPGTLDWITGSVRILLKCLARDWQAGAVDAEPKLPSYALPCGRVMLAGRPDLRFVSSSGQGTVLLEIKSGWKSVGVEKLKVARYLGAGWDDACRRKAPPMRGLWWASFASTKRDARSGLPLWRPQPQLTLRFLPFEQEWVDQRLERSYGVRCDDLPRYRINSWH